ncbi:hypothetical protein ACFQ6V_09095 [Streptomyces roseifaciens]
MPVSVLIEGMDLTGKTTLATLLAAQLEDRGVRTVLHRGFLARRHPLRPVLDRTEPGMRPADSTLNTAFILGSLMDRALPGVLDGRDHEVVIQESYVDRAIAYGMAAGGWMAARYAARHPDRFVSFDLGVLTRAPLAVRRARARARGGGDRVDARTLHDEAFGEEFWSTLEHVAARHREVVLVDSDARLPQESVQEIAARVVTLAGREGRA